LSHSTPAHLRLSVRGEANYPRSRSKPDGHCNEGFYP
jgi:hypothetical protein